MRAPFGNFNTTFGLASSAFGNFNTTFGDNSSAFGTFSLASGDNSSAFGNLSTALSPLSSAFGTFSTAGGDNSSAFGANSMAQGESSTALGANSMAEGDASTAIGADAFAAGQGDTAIGEGATVTADHSTAIGAGATATLPNQVVLGTKSDSYTAPGITSSLSRSRQSGPTQIVTSDANGNLATDGGRFFDKVDESQSGVALAMAIQNPNLAGNERFGVAANWGAFEDSNALGAALMGVLGHDFVTKGDRVAISGGFGVGFSNGDGDDVLGGRVGLQWTR